MTYIRIEDWLDRSEIMDCFRTNFVLWVIRTIQVRFTKACASSIDFTPKAKKVQLDSTISNTRLQRLTDLNIVECGGPLVEEWKGEACFRTEDTSRYLYSASPSIGSLERLM